MNPIRPIIFGSAEGDNVPMQPTDQNPLVALNEFLMFPVNALLAISKASGITDQMQEAKARYTRSYLPQGGVKPQMTTSELNAKNIFGETGGY
jgi:hypothetical protein